MRKRWSAAALIALLAVLALLAAGCGGDSSSDAGGDTTAVEETTGEETDGGEATTDEMETTDEEEGGGVSPFASDDCLELASIGAKFAEAAAPTGSQSDPAAIASAFDELVDKAPDAIKDDLAVLSEAISEITAALKDVDLSQAGANPETLAKLQELGQKFSDPKYQQASQNIEAWAQENCSASG